MRARILTIFKTKNGLNGKSRLQRVQCYNDVIVYYLRLVVVVVIYSTKDFYHLQRRRRFDHNAYTIGIT